MACIFSPLVVPVKVTFLVVPPQQGKDLDYIALTCLPLVHEVLRPCSFENLGDRRSENRRKSLKLIATWRLVPTGVVWRINA